MSEITTTISELLATSRQIAESAQRVAHIADQTATAARSGHGTVDTAQDSISGIRRQVDQIVGHMLELGKKSQEIGSVLDIVAELSEQTNILAINATIEAAGAGDSGRRFAVVADEIRKLADRVGGSTKEIRTLIDEVRSAVNTTVMATETGSKAVDAGSRQFGDVAAAFRQIAGPGHDHDGSRARDRAVDEAAIDRGRAGEPRGDQRGAGVEGDRDQLAPDAAHRVAAGRDLQRSAAHHPATGRRLNPPWRRTPTGTSGSKRASCSISSRRACWSWRKVATARRWFSGCCGLPIR
ncbi:MAG: methyl-accepting chemotaxis protein [Aliidongia sp.]